LIEWLILCVLPLTISLIFSWLIIHYLAKRLLDIPNIRSSHQAPTPRGGGIALAGGIVITLLIAWYFAYIDAAPLYWLALPAGLISILGICDDLFNLTIGIRLSVQFLLATIGVCFIGIDNDWPPVIRVLSLVIMILFIVWMINLYNFMDGINGLAALEAISVCIGMALIYRIQNANLDALYLLMIIAAGTSGFLFWNFPRAKLFMGDSGSLFLGLSLGLLTIQSLSINNYLCVAWLIMLGIFIVDASYTLFYRVITKQAFHQAHRTHAYQKIAMQLKSHTNTTIAAVAINLLWLLPIAIAAATTKLNAVMALVIAYAPLIFITQKYRAGRKE
jgi:Fuc2NAc and GlcNAc transferase